MRKKIGTALHEHLVVQLKEIAAREGRQFNELLEDAIERYLSSRNRDARVSLVDATAGKYRVSKKQLEEVMAEDMYDR